MTSKPGRAGGKGLALATTGPIVAAVLLLAGLIFPLVITNETATQIAVDTLLFVAAAGAWNPFSGFTGYISLGHAAFFGTGAYTVRIAAQDWHVTGDLEFALLPLAGPAAGPVALPLWLTARRRARPRVLCGPDAASSSFSPIAFSLRPTARY